MNEVNPYESPTAPTNLGDDEAYEPKMFAINGRIGRARYFLYSMVYNLILGGVIGLLSVALGVGVGMFEGEMSPGFSAFVGITYVLGFAVFFIIARRRLNDLNRSGWWNLVIVVPLVNLIFALYLLLAPGTQGANRFGPPPTKSSSVLIIVLLGLSIVFLGILAAVAIPAYQDYVQRAAEFQGQVGP